MEQDLILSRAIVDIFSNNLLANTLVFRGGTALHKLYSPTQERYSEDLDFVQKDAGPIGPIMGEIHNILNPWLGDPQWKQTQGRVTFYYKYESEILPIRKMKLKLEINTREHHSFTNLTKIPFSVSSRWFKGDALVTSYTLEELMGTKMRALYQRKKGRDMFDLIVMMKHYPHLNCQNIVDCFLFYLKNENLHVSRAEYEKNMDQKLKDRLFLEDIVPLLQNGKNYSPEDSYKIIHEKIIRLLPGESWKGPNSWASS